MSVKEFAGKYIAGLSQPDVVQNHAHLQWDMVGLDEFKPPIVG